jgi:hypothetical protein
MARGLSPPTTATACSHGLAPAWRRERRRLAGTELVGATLRLAMKTGLPGLASNRRSTATSCGSVTVRKASSLLPAQQAQQVMAGE